MGNSNKKANKKPVSMWTEVKLSWDQELAVKKLGLIDYTIVHVFDCGSMLVNNGVKYTFQDNDLYLVSKDGKVKKTLHSNICYEHFYMGDLIPRYQVIETTFRARCELNLFHQNLYIHDPSKEVMLGYNAPAINLPDLEGYDGFSWIKYFLSYGGVLVVNYRCDVPVIERKTKFFRCKALDEIVKKELLPISAEFLRESERVLVGHLGVNVSGVVVEYL